MRDAPEQRAVGAARHRLHLRAQVFDFTPLRLDQTADEFEMRFGVEIDVFFDADAGPADAASRVLEGTIDDGRRTRIEEMSIHFVARNATRRVASVGTRDRVSWTLVVMTLM